MSAPTPSNEVLRLKTLLTYKILDTNPQARFDDLANLAAAICETPISTITFVDERRQWFKARVGMPKTEGPREDAICAHALMSPEMFIVPDTLEDQRFAENPAVLGAPHIRFYAGKPLMAPNGAALGTLCVIDRKPRELTPLQLESLRVLGQQVMDQLELEKNLAELRQSLTIRDIMERENERLIAELQAALANVQTLQGLMPICSWCRKVREDDGYWGLVEDYVSNHSNLQFSHGICPGCAEQEKARRHSNTAG